MGLLSYLSEQIQTYSIWQYNNSCLHLNAVELIKAGPSSRLSQSFEELTHGLVVQAIRAVEHHTLETDHNFYISNKKKRRYVCMSVSFFTCLAKAFARSFVVSVLPVPAGPSGAPPKFNFKAPIRVLVWHKVIWSHRTIWHLAQWAIDCLNLHWYLTF